MEIVKRRTSKELGRIAAEQATEIIDQSIRRYGDARILLSTGASQFDFFEEFVCCDIDWSKVEMFHLDEYVGIGENHKASFVKYLKERFEYKLPVKLKAVHYIDGTRPVADMIGELSRAVQKREIDLGLIGIGENAHIAFNDPPADFNCEEPYIVVNLNETCKRQQVREGWFPDTESVCAQAISMSCRQIMKCRNIISFVPYRVKAEAIAKMLSSDTVTNLIPATLLKTHNSFTLYVDEGSSLLVKAL